MKTKVFIQQILSTEIEIDIPEQLSKTDLEQYVRENVLTPNYAMNYYDRQVSKSPVYKDWTLDNETIMRLGVVPENNSKSKDNYSEEDGYND